MSDLQTLMMTDPLKLTKDNIDAIITELRNARQAFNLGNMKAGSTKPASAKTKEATSLAKALEIDL